MDRFFGVVLCILGIFERISSVFYAVLTPIVQNFGWILPFGLGGYAPFSATIHDLEVKLESIGVDSTVVHKKFGKGTVVKINKNEKFIGGLHFYCLSH